MRVLIVDSGIGSSTGDVFRGYVGAFERAGHTVIRYQLSARIDQANFMLQRAWEQAGKPPNKPTGGDIYFRASEGVLMFALNFEADLVVVITSQFLHPNLLVCLERAHLNVAIICTESPYMDRPQAHYLQAVDCGFTNERASVARLRELSENENIWYLPCAYDPTLHRPEPGLDEPDVASHDVVFVGTAFQERIDLLEAVDWTGIDLGLYGDWNTLGRKSKLRQFVKGGLVPNATTTALYRKAKIGLNLYRDGLVFNGEPGEQLTIVGAESVPTESMNPRAYELAATGCFQISQYRAEVWDLFGVNVPTFRTAYELGVLIRHFLANPKTCQLYADHCRDFVRSHTFDARIIQLLDHVRTVPTIVPQRVGLTDRFALHAVSAS